MAEREVLGLKKLLVAVVTESSLSRAATGRVSVEVCWRGCSLFRLRGVVVNWLLRSYWL